MTTRKGAWNKVIQPNTLFSADNSQDDQLRKLCWDDAMTRFNTKKAAAKSA